MGATGQIARPLSETWKNLLRLVMEHGDDTDLEIREARTVTMDFTVEPSDITELADYGLKETLSEMRKVFFTSEKNRFGHSYRSCWRGPFGREDLTDVIDLLKEQPSTKRALFVFIDPTGKKVPCVNAIHFLIRHGRLDLSYFARGQDVYLKFCADAICVHDFGALVSEALGIRVGTITGTISSAHIYRKDFERVESILNPARR
ncbi:MAG: thymidylate synthase [Rhodocyclaceae bacterium]|nr:thymidylate synthase [Rhodocyclaceae bacterium]MDZ4216356.1 thymidylate synthase [Rhodocyclaceae bacterium]